jgi:hypothetical protein
MAMAFNKLIQAKYLDLPIEELLALPPSALKGVSQGDADLLDQAFGIKTIKDFGKNKFFHNAFNLVRAGIAPGFDPGPPLQWEQRFADAPVDDYLNHSEERFRIEYGPVFYRGRLDGTARLLVVGQDPSTDEIIAQRAFVGASGQRLQRYLNKVGITRSYVIINTFIFSIYGQFDDEMRAISLEAPIKDYRNSLFDAVIQENPIEAIITFGNGPKHAIENWDNPGELPVFNLVHPAAPEETAFPNWNAQLQPMIDTISADDPSLIDTTPYEGSWRRDIHKADIPRYDLPFGIPEWHGTHGTRSKRGPDDKKKNITWKAV